MGATRTQCERERAAGTLDVFFGMVGGVIVRPLRGRLLCFRLVASLLIGIVLTFLMAWASMCFPINAVYKPLTQWPCKVPDEWPPPTDSVQAVGGNAPGFAASARGPNGSILLATGGSFGLPVPAVSWRAVIVSEGSTVTTIYAWGRWQGLPLRPTWPGFALDTAFYTAIAFILWTAPGVVRRCLRRARGHCPACGYDLKDSPSATCPECGA